MMTVLEAARELRCGRTRVFVLLRAGLLARAVTCGRATYVTSESVRALLGGPTAVGPEDPAAERQRLRAATRAVSALVRADRPGGRGPRAA